MTKFVNRKYQDDCVKVGIEVLTDKKGRKEVIVSPTASGKSLIIASIVNAITDGNCLVIQPSSELLLQNLNKVKSFGLNPAVYSASMKRKELGKVIYSTPKSLNYEALKTANIKYVIIDECDYNSQSSSELIKLLKKLKIKSVLGLTASPLYLTATVEGSEIKIMTQVTGAFFDDICKVISVKEMVDSNYWSDLKYYNVFDAEKQKLLKLNPNGSEYTEESQSDYYVKAGVKDKVIKLLKRLPENESALVFVPSIVDVDEMVKGLPGSVGVHSKTDKKLRSKHVEDFKDNTIRIVVTPLALLAGFDKPDLNNIIDCTPSNSLRVKIQKDGRGCRIHPTKTVCNIVDYAGNYNRFGDVRDIVIEKVDGYGWGVFSKDKLMTDVLLSSDEVITLQDLKEGKRPNKNSFTFSFENKGDAKMSQGKFKGKELKYLYYKKRFYLKYLIEKNYKFCKEDEEFERQLKNIFK